VNNTLSPTGRTQDLGEQITSFLIGLVQAIIAERLLKYLAPALSAWWTRFEFESFAVALLLSATSVKMVEGIKDSRLSSLVLIARLFLSLLLRILPFGIRGIGHLSEMRLDARPVPYSLTNRSAYIQYVKEHPPDQPTIWLCLAVLFLSAFKGSALSVVRD